MSSYLTAKLGADDLLECANCGGDPEWRDGSSTTPYIRCKQCGMRTPSSRSYDKLRAIWNTRATLGSGTCKLEETASYPSERGTVHVLECNNCGNECEHVNGDYEHCPHCMARNELF